MVLAAAFVAAQIVYPEVPDTVVEGLRKDQHLAPLILQEVKESSFWRLFWDGKLPMRRDGYHGTLMAYLYMPFYALLGPDWRLIKFWYLLFSVPGLVLTYLVTREILDRTTAVCGLALLVCHPHFVLGMRADDVTHGYLLFFTAAPLFLLARWWNTKDPRYFYGGAFLLGLGMTTQFWYFWLIAALAPVAALYRSQLLRRPPFDRGLRWAAYSLLSFSAGAAVFVYHEVWHPLETFAALWERLGSRSSASPFYLERLVEMVRFINANFSNIEFYLVNCYQAFVTPAVSGNRLFPYVLWASAAWLCWRAARGGGRRLLIFPVMTFMIVLLASVQEIAMHPFFLYPFVVLTVASAAVEVFRAAAGRKVLTGALALCAAVFFSIELANMRSLFRFLADRQTAHERNLYDLAHWLWRSGPGDKIVLRYGWHRNLGENDNLALACQVPGKKFRFVYNLKDPAFRGPAGSGIEVRLFSESKAPSGEVTVLPILHSHGEPLDPAHWPPTVVEWFQKKKGPEARFGDPSRGLLWEVYEGRMDESGSPETVIRETPRTFLL